VFFNKTDNRGDFMKWFFVLCFFMLTGMLFAGNDQRVKGTVSWKNKLRLGFSLTGGNSALLNFNGGLSIHRNRLWVNEIGFAFDFDIREDRQALTYRKFTSHLRYGHSLNRRWYVFGGLWVASDLAAQLDYQLNPAAGTGYWLEDSKVLKWMQEIGAGYTDTRYLDGSFKGFWSLYARLFIKWQALKNLTLTEIMKYTPSVENFLDFHFQNDIKATLKIQKNFSFLLRFKLDYENLPVSGTLSVDDILSSGLQWSF